MIEINVGIKREHFLAQMREARAAFAEGSNVVGFTFYGKSNKPPLDEDVSVTFSNDDMEREEVPADCILVDVERMDP